MAEAALTVLVVVVSYLVGSVPFGIIASRARGLDLREHGSRRSGATNALRLLGWRVAAMVFAADVAKGVAAVLLARLVAGTTEAEVLAGLAAIAGHNWPVYAGFRGGRGVATSLGAIVLISPWAALFCVVVFAIVTAAWRYVSLGSILAAVTALVSFAAFAAAGQLHGGYVLLVAIGAPLLVFQHRDNIERLLAGRERRLF